MARPRILTTVQLLLDEDSSPARTESGLVCAFIGAQVPEAYAELARELRIVEATVTYELAAARPPAGEAPPRPPKRKRSAFRLPAEFTAPTLAQSFHAGAMSAAGDACPHLGNREVAAWNAGRVAAGLPPAVVTPAPAAPPKPAPAPKPVGRDGAGVPVDVPGTARSAYLEGRDARLGGQGKELNPFEGERRVPGARRLARLRGWQEAS